LRNARGVLFVQIDLVGRAADGEPQCLVGRPAIKIVFERDGDLCCHPGLLDGAGPRAPYKINCHATGGIAVPGTAPVNSRVSWRH
jgi:hypothetical protein